MKICAGKNANVSAYRMCGVNKIRKDQKINAEDTI
jgi:hypothetical protein